MMRRLTQHELIASASASGIGAAYARGRLTGHRDDALAELAASLERYKVPGDRRTAVLSHAAVHFLDGEPDRADGLALLVEAGADADAAWAIRNDPRA